VQQRPPRFETLSKFRTGRLLSALIVDDFKSEEETRASEVHREAAAFQWTTGACMLADSKHHQMNVEEEERMSSRIEGCMTPTLKPDLRGINLGRVSSIKSRPAWT
jgi:hypothetical protein